jgi:hypothetical protein
MADLCEEKIILFYVNEGAAPPRIDGTISMVMNNGSLRWCCVVYHLVWSCVVQVEGVLCVSLFSSWIFAKMKMARATSMVKTYNFPI